MGLGIRRNVNSDLYGYTPPEIETGDRFFGNGRSSHQKYGFGVWFYPWVRAILKAECSGLHRDPQKAGNHLKTTKEGKKQQTSVSPSGWWPRPVPFPRPPALHSCGSTALSPGPGLETPPPQGGVGIQTWQGGTNKR